MHGNYYQTAMGVPRHGCYILMSLTGQNVLVFLGGRKEEKKEKSRCIRVELEQQIAPKGPIVTRKQTNA